MGIMHVIHLNSLSLYKKVMQTEGQTQRKCLGPRENDRSTKMSPALAPAVLHSEPVALVSVWTVLVLRFCDVSADIVLALELFRISLPVCVAKAMEAISFRVYCLHGQCFHCCFYLFTNCSCGPTDDVYSRRTLLGLSSTRLLKVTQSYMRCSRYLNLVLRYRVCTPLFGHLCFSNIILMPFIF